MEEKLEEAIKVLAEKSKEAVNANDALKYTQAALNAANTLCTLRSVERN